MSGVREGDGVVIVGASQHVLGFAKVYRIRAALDSTKLYFDCFHKLTPPASSSSMGLSASVLPIERVAWDAFDSAIFTATGKSFAEMTPVSGQSQAEQNHLRHLLQLAVMDDLLGPANGPQEEVVGMSVRDRYLVGKLAPKETCVTEEEDEDLGTEGEDDSTKEFDASRNQSLVPSSVGFTFCIDADVREIELEVRWGRYERRPDLDVVEEKRRLKKKKPALAILAETPVEADADEGRVEEESASAPLPANASQDDYEIFQRKHRCWKRIPCGAKRRFRLDEGPVTPFAIDPDCPSVLIKGVVRPASDQGVRLVTLFLLNQQEKPDESQDAAWVFQPEIAVRGLEGAAVFRRRPALDTGRTGDAELSERLSLEMVYRKRVEFAVGHGIAIHAKTAEANTEAAVEIRTVVMPEYEVQVTEAPGGDPADRPAMRALMQDGIFDMERLAAFPKDELVAALRRLTDDYAAWIAQQVARIPQELPAYAEEASEAMDRCERIRTRLVEGILMIEEKPEALEAFRFANRAMARQRVRSAFSLRRRRAEDVTVEQMNTPANRSWRPFQLAFVLLSIPALADPLHTDRTEPVDAAADLLWFPTGGGKTEAYLGVAAFAMGIRRLQKNLGGLDSSRGLAVIMRYTLRLLTIQQFQRATTLLCAMETLRHADTAKWGTTPFTLGLWVGNKVSPGTTKRAHEIIKMERDSQHKGWSGGGETPAQLTFCPWCGSDIKPGRDIEVNEDTLRTTLYCGDKLSQCEFSRGHTHGLPVVVVDEELYHRPPSMLIGTVDKFAMMAWRGETRTLFGRASRECSRHGLLIPDCDCTGTHNAKGQLPKTSAKEISPLRPPDLIIQDEFHLISGPLGTMVGLYESAIDELSSWPMNGKTIRPKVIASTATVRKAREQVHNVFLRNVSVFPPHGLDIEDNYFSVQRPLAQKPGRLYLGICSPGSSRPAVLIRLYVALLTAAQELFNRFGQAADPYMTLVGYFNALRELGGMRRLAEDDVQTRAFRVAMSKVVRPGLAQRKVKEVDELTSRVSSKEIPRKLDQLETKYKANWEKGESKSIDVVLATNMLSVGVDVNRLGLMAVNGQPKSTAEYIQATSRVGRAHLGLVCSVLTWSRPRDLSHYETFEHYHATFYKHVEAQSVTPFAARAMDRGLTGAFTSLLRLTDAHLSPNLGAGELTSVSHPSAVAAKSALVNRAWKVSDSVELKTRAEGLLRERIDKWVKEANRPGRSLGYESSKNVVELLKKPGVERWSALTAPMSLREVEPGVKLIMDTSTLQDGPAWKRPLPKKSKKQDHV